MSEDTACLLGFAGVFTFGLATVGLPLWIAALLFIAFVAAGLMVPEENA
jgi:hypothetical protein